MSLKDTKARVLELRKELNEHNYNYHVLANPTIPDAAYDRLFAELQQLERLHPELADVNSPTARVGHAIPTSGQTVRHRHRMLSLENAFTAADIVKSFKKGAEVTLEPKIDGLACELVYEKGVLIQAATRGDGTVGQDVTANVRTIYTVPLELREPVSIRVRGEVYMTYPAFNQLNVELSQAGDDMLANPRNAASGSIGLKDPKECARRRLSFAAFGTPDVIKGIKTQAKLIEYFEMLGFQSMTTLPVVQALQLPPLVGVIENEEQVKALIARMDEHRKLYDFATDGLVFKLNSLKEQQDIGEGTRSPNWARAYKFPPERKSTMLLDIKVGIGRTGKVTPTAVLQDVVLSGTFVSSATLNNARYIAEKNVNIGDEVWVEKSAEIIPNVMGVAKKHSKGVWQMPLECPECETKLIQFEGLIDHYCPNKTCRKQVFARLRHATCKAALDIDGCGEVMIRELMKHGVKTLSDLLSIEDLSFLKQAARRNIEEGREKAKGAALWRKIHALGVEGIGRTKSQELAAKWPALYAMFDDMDALKAVLGEVVFTNFCRYMEENADEIDRLDMLGFKFECERLSQGPLTGKFFVITGTMMSGKRDEVISRIEECGGTVKSSVGKSVNYLVLGEQAGNNKQDAAKKFGTVVITEEQLYQLMGKPMPLVTVDADRDY